MLGKSEELISTGDWTLPRPRQRRWVRTSTWPPAKPGKKRRSNVSPLSSPTCQICRAPGCCCIPVPPPEPTTSCTLHSPHAEPIPRRTTIDAADATCLGSFVPRTDQMPAAALQAARLAFGFGGLGLRSAAADRHAAFWSSWLDTLPAIQARSPRTLPMHRSLLTFAVRS